MYTVPSNSWADAHSANPDGITLGDSGHAAVYEWSLGSEHVRLYLLFYCSRKQNKTETFHCWTQIYNRRTNFIEMIIRLYKSLDYLSLLHSARVQNDEHPSKHNNKTIMNRLKRSFLASPSAMPVVGPIPLCSFQLRSSQRLENWTSSVLNLET